MRYRRPPRAQTVAPMSQGLRVLVLGASTDVCFQEQSGHAATASGGSTGANDPNRT